MEPWRATDTRYDPAPARTPINIAPICQHPRARGEPHGLSVEPAFTHGTVLSIGTTAGASRDTESPPGSR
jgi:hypothetical protein